MEDRPDNECGSWASTFEFRGNWAEIGMRPHHKYGDELFMVNQNATLSFNYKLMDKAYRPQDYGNVRVGSIIFKDWLTRQDCVGVWYRFEETFISLVRGRDVYFEFRGMTWHVRINNLQFSVYDERL